MWSEYGQNSAGSENGSMADFCGTQTSGPTTAGEFYGQVSDYQNLEKDYSVRWCWVVNVIRLLSMELERNQAESEGPDSVLYLTTHFHPVPRLKL
jgi:hypothetical protein